MAKEVSYSQLSLFYYCSWAWYLKYVKKEKAIDTMSLIMGSAVHKFVGHILYKKAKDPTQEFFFANKDKVLGGYTNYWYRTIWPEYSKFFGYGSGKWGLDTSLTFIENYLKLATGRGKPFEKERTLRMYVPELGCTLRGDIDQIRPTNLAWLEKERPEWYAQKKKNGELENSHVLIDLKTGYSEVYYSTNENVSIETQRRKQTSLMNSLQVTMYYYLYYRNFGKYPDAFIYWFVGDNPQIITTYRDQPDFDNMFDLVKDFMKRINSLDEHDYPKVPFSKNCAYCQYYLSCWGDRERPDIQEPIPIDSELQPHIPYVSIRDNGTKFSQPRLKNIHVPRQRIPTDRERAQREKEEYERRMNESKENTG